MTALGPGNTLREGNKAGMPVEQGEGATAPADTGTEPTGQETPPTETPTDNEPAPAEQSKGEEKVYTQEEVDRIVQARLGKERDRARSRTSEEVDTMRAELDQARSDLAEAQLTAMRVRIAAQYGISTAPDKEGEQSDMELFLTGTDEETLRSQAERLSSRTSVPQGTHVPDSGGNDRPSDDEHTNFVRQLFSPTGTN